MLRDRDVQAKKVRVALLVPLAETPAGDSAPLRGAATQPRPSSFSRGFTPNPAPAPRSPSAAVESQQLPARGTSILPS